MYECSGRSCFIFAYIYIYIYKDSHREIYEWNLIKKQIVVNNKLSPVLNHEPLNKAKDYKQSELYVLDEANLC